MTDGMGRLRNTVKKEYLLKGERWVAPGSHTVFYDLINIFYNAFPTLLYVVVSVK